MQPPCACSSSARAPSEAISGERRPSRDCGPHLPRARRASALHRTDRGARQVLSPDQIATHLGDRFCFLSSQIRIVEPRHRTLRAALDWSYELLTADEQNLFCGLSVFAGRFTSRRWGVCLQGDESQCLELITSLVDASLVGVENDPGSSGGMRYRLLETLREYGADRLAEAGKRPELWRTHAEYYLRHAEAAQLSTEAVGEQRFETVLTEQENLRAAFDWALESDVVLVRISRSRSSSCG